MGTNAKMHLQFTSRFWRDQGCNGETYSRPRLPEHVGGLPCAGRQERPARLVHRRQLGVAVGSGTPESQGATFLKQIEPVLPARPRSGTAR